MSSGKEARDPTVTEALISLVSLVVGIGVSIAYYGLNPQIPMLFGVVVASVIALRCGFSWESIQRGMIRGITHALPSIIILMIVGILIGLWILGGVVPTLVYYGLDILAPSYFLPATVVICAIASLATGTSWGTTGTIGVALMGVGTGLGMPLPLVAGAALSGAYFGDKMSPLSDTTNLAPAMVGVDLYTHIRHMASTAGVSIGLTLLIEIVIGLRYSAEGAGDTGRIETIQRIFNETYLISPWLLIPPVLVLVVSWKKMPAIPGIGLGAIAGLVCAFIAQGASYDQAVTAAYAGIATDTGNADVDSLLSRGGLESMFFTISLILVAMMYGGVMESTRQIRVLAERILEMANSTGSLILTTALTAIGSNFLLCDQYMSLVLTGRMYENAYRDRGLAPENLSRVTEDAGTVVDPLVPWGSGGAYQTATLGVSTFAYAPFAFFCWISPLVTILFGYMGWTIRPRDPEAPSDFDEEPDELVGDVSGASKA